MTADSWLKGARGLAVAAGGLDFATGLGLVGAPAFTLARMGAPVPGGEALLYVRFVGVFVAAVGASYLGALALGGARRLRSVFEFTLLFRLGAGTFTGLAVARGLLAPAWLAVTATDFALVGAQSWLLTKGAGRHG
ncbi:MAG TPA: hypothetical protein VGD81_17900 [Opitutaceae bacterium]